MLAPLLLVVAGVLNLSTTWLRIAPVNDPAEQSDRDQANRKELSMTIIFSRFAVRTLLRDFSTGPRHVLVLTSCRAVAGAGVRP